MTSDEFAKAIDGNPLVILPVGALEAHGPHLPLSADTLQPLALAKAIAKQRKALILPPLWYGYCWETGAFPGTVSLRFETLMAVARDLVADLYRNGVRKLLVISGHGAGPHMEALRVGARAVVQAHEDLQVVVFTDYDFAYELLGQKGIPAKDGHAGFVETARVLAISPRLVRGHQAVKSDWPRFGRFEVVGRPSEHWKTGVMGDPRMATAAAGTLINRHVQRRAMEAVDRVFEGR